MSDSVAAASKEIPASNKYNPIDLDKIKERTRFTKIRNANSPRFKPTIKTLEPSPTSYHTIETTRNSKFAETARTKFNKDKRVSYFETCAKKNKSPGAGHYKDIDKAYNILSNSPRKASCRRH